MRRLECRQRNNSDIWIHHVACKFHGFFHKAPTLYRYLEAIIACKWYKQGSQSSSRPLTGRGLHRFFFENFRENILKGDLSNYITLNPPLFSLVSTFNANYEGFVKPTDKNILARISSETFHCNQTWCTKLTSPVAKCSDILCTSI
jgi:hypothetical protein